MEIGSSVKPHPYGLKPLKSYIHEYLLQIGETETAKEYGLQSFEVNVLDIERTFVDKLMTVKRHAICGSLPMKVRHIYDVVRLLDMQVIQDFMSNNEELKEIIQMTKKTDSKYLEKRNIPEEYNPMGPYDFKSWKGKFNSGIKSSYEDLHNHLLYTDIQQEWDQVEKTFERINQILKDIDE